MSPAQIKLVVILLGLALLAYGGYSVGQKLERLEWTERESKINAEAAVKIKKAAEQAAETEREQGKKLLDETTAYYEGIQDDLDEKNRIIAGAVSGAIVLSVPTKHPCSGHAQGEGAAGAGGAEGAPRAELSDEAGKFLVGEATRADAYTRQLNAVIGALEACEKVAAAP